MSTVSLAMDQAHRIYCDFRKYERLISFHERERIIKYCVLNSKRDDIHLHFYNSDGSPMSISEISLKEHGSAMASFDNVGAFQLMNFIKASNTFGVRPELNLELNAYSSLMLVIKSLENLNDLLKDICDENLDVSHLSKQEFTFKDHDKNHLLNDKREFEQWFLQQS